MTLGTHQTSIAPHATVLVNLVEMQTASVGQGGVRITYDGPSDGLKINGGLEDESVGYSARLPLHFPPMESAENATQEFVSLDLMRGLADPMMSFPANTRFSPYVITRNISMQPLRITPLVWWMEGIVPHTVTLPDINLAPYETRNLDLAEQLKHEPYKHISERFNVVLKTKGQSRALLESAGSVDDNNNYVFEVASMVTMESEAKSVSYWSVGEGDDTMITLWNPSDEAQDFSLVLNFSEGDGRYVWPIHLNAKETHSSIFPKYFTMGRLTTQETSFQHRCTKEAPC